MDPARLQKAMDETMGGSPPPQSEQIHELLVQVRELKAEIAAMDEFAQRVRLIQNDLSAEDQVPFTDELERVLRRWEGS